VKILDRYLLKETLLPALFSLLFLLFLLVGQRFLKMFTYLMEIRIPLEEVGKLLLYLVPSFVVFALPPALFLGIVVGLSRMGSDGEISAWQTMGTHPLRIVRSLIFLSFLLVLTSLFLSQWGYPQGRKIFRKKWNYLLELSLFTSFLPGSVEKIPHTGVVAKTEEEGNSFMILYQEEERRFLAGYPLPPSAPRTVELRDGYWFSFSGTMPVFGRFSTATVEILPFWWEVEEGVGPQGKTLWELWNDRKDPPSATELHKRLTLTFASLLAPFGGFLLASRRRRTGRSPALLYSLLSLTLFYTFLTLGQKLAMKGSIPPWLGGWLPILLFGPFTFFTFTYLLRRPSHL
jgi:lipopolysaccharide export system permease protein